MPQEQVVYENQPVHSDEIYANMMQEERIKNVIAQTSPDNQLADIEWRIRGYKKNVMTQQWEKISKLVAEPNARLVSGYISYLSSILNDSTRFTNLSSHEINKIMKLMIEWLTDDMNSNADEYGLRGNYTERTRIGHIMLNSTFIVLKRSQNGMESGRIWRAMNMTESFNQPQQQKPKWYQFWKQG